MMDADGRSVSVGSDPSASAMKSVEFRRHSVRDKPSVHLSPTGVAVAREVGRESRPFQLVVSRPVARAVETAELMGFPADFTRAIWGDLGNGAIPWPLSFSGYGRLLAAKGLTEESDARLHLGILGLVELLGDEGAVLVVTHGGFPELVAASMSSLSELEELGGPPMHGSSPAGVRGSSVECATVLRAPLKRPGFRRPPTEKFEGTGAALRGRPRFLSVARVIGA